MMDDMTTTAEAAAAAAASIALPSNSSSRRPAVSGSSSSTISGCVSLRTEPMSSTLPTEKSRTASLALSSFSSRPARSARSSSNNKEAERHGMDGQSNACESAEAEDEKSLYYMITHASWHVTLGCFISMAVVCFSLYFPFLLAPWAAQETYHFAFYDYDPDISHFDNTIWTYGTDYLLAFCMAVISYVIPTKLLESTSSASDASAMEAVVRTHAFRSRGLLICYLLSVMAGGLAHQFYTTLESRNSNSFRFLWTLCVGTVAAASSFMGSIGTQLARYDRQQGLPPPSATFKSVGSSSASAPTPWWRKLPSSVPVIQEFFWIGFGLCAVVVVICGGFSFHRPACDIFITGITQTPSTFYMMYTFYTGLPTTTLSSKWRYAGMVSFILNAPLLPMYPLLVQYTNWSLASVNTLLHTWLLLAWGLQGLALRQVSKALLEAAESQPARAVPIAKKTEGLKKTE